MSLLSLSTACTNSTERVWLDAPGWYRAQKVGDTELADPVPIAVDDVGTVYLFLVTAPASEGSSADTSDVTFPRVIALDRHVESIWDRTYDEIELTSPRQPQIFWDDNGLQLFWISAQSLYAAFLNTTGDLSAPPIVLSGAAQVDSYDVSRDASGLITIWYAGPRQNPGLYALPPQTLFTPLRSGAGLKATTQDWPQQDALLQEATLVDAEGIRPDLQVDRAGALHATWAHYPPGYGGRRVLYAMYPDGVYRPGRETVVFEPRQVPSVTFAGPHLGLDHGQTYVFWTETSHAGTEAGKVETLYVHFPLGQPSLVSSAQPVRVPSAHNLTYSPFPEGDLKSGDRVAWNDAGRAQITDVEINPLQGQELAITFRTRIDYLRHQERSQTAILFLQDGDPTAYQLLSFTPADSLDPAIVSDPSGQLYVTWLEKGTPSGFEVFFASTARDIRAALGSLNRNDIGRHSAETLFGLLGGALLIPMVLVWTVAPTIVVGLTSVIRWENARLSGLVTLFGLALPLGVYWVSKLMTLPGMREYVPFSAWLPFIPSWLSGPLQWGVPLVFTGLGLVLAWNYTYRRSNPSKLLFVLIYAVTDGVLTVAVYGVLFYGAV